MSAELDAAIAAAEDKGNLELAAQLRGVRDRTNQTDVRMGEFSGRRWTATEPPVDQAEVYPNPYRWRQQAGVVIEFGDRGDLSMIDPWTGRVFRLDSVLADDGSTPFAEAACALMQAAESVQWFAGSHQTGRAGQVRR